MPRNGSSSHCEEAHLLGRINRVFGGLRCVLDNQNWHSGCSSARAGLCSSLKRGPGRDRVPHPTPATAGEGRAVL